MARRASPASFAGLRRMRYQARPAAPVAQLDRALPSEGRGQGFESLRVRQNIDFTGFSELLGGKSMSKGRSVSNTVSNIRADSPPPPIHLTGFQGPRIHGHFPPSSADQIRGSEAATGDASGQDGGHGPRRWKRCSLRAGPAGRVYWVCIQTRSEGLRALRWQGRRQAEHRDPHRRRPQGRAGSHGCLLRLAEGDAPTSSGNSRAQVTDMSGRTARLTNPNRLSNISGALHPERCGGSGRGGENSIATAGSLTANLLTRPRAES